MNRIEKRDVVSDVALGLCSVHDILTVRVKYSVVGIKRLTYWAAFNRVMNSGHDKVIRDFEKRMGRSIEKIDMSTRVGTRLRDELLVFLKG